MLVSPETSAKDLEPPLIVILLLLSNGVGRKCIVVISVGLWVVTKTQW